MTAPQDLTSHYRLEQVLSWTGVARTFRGIDPDSGDPVAVKLLTLGATHRKIAAYLAALGIERAGDAWESYVSDPTKVPESELLTYVYYPISSI